VTSANLDLVRSIYADWERGDYARADWADPEIEFVFADGPEPGSYQGLAGMAGAMRGWLSAWEDHRQQLEECRELDRERILVLHRFGASGKTSGVDLGQIGGDGAALFHVGDGKVTRIIVYWDRERALTDLWRESYEGWARGS
jgi:ketosteroid isomerase-like protein